MAFRFETKLCGYEYRNQRSGVSEKTGKRWLSLIVEGEDGTQLDVGVSSELISEVDSIGLRKGDMLDMPVLVVSAREYSFVRLVGMPTVYDENGEVL